MIITVRAPVGNINMLHKDAVIGRGVASIDSKKFENFYLYYLLEFESNALENQSTGTTYDSISSGELRNYKVIVPDEKSIQKYNDFVKPIHNEKLLLREENILLKDLRDYLLPVLLSGDYSIDGETAPDNNIGNR